MPNLVLLVKCNKCYGTCSHIRQTWTMRPRPWMRGKQLAGRSLHCPFLLAEETSFNSPLLRKKQRAEEIVLDELPGIAVFSFSSILVLSSLVPQLWVRYQRLLSRG